MSTDALAIFQVRLFSISQPSLLKLNNVTILMGMHQILSGENQNITFLKDYMMVLMTLSDVSFPHEAIFNYDLDQWSTFK